jgi:ABC-2 type transport system ATP-binding protein
MSSSPPALAIDAQGLVKRFGRARALDGLDLTVPPGEVHGFLGPNGAGKSTTIRILLGLVRATSGRARVFGLDPWRESAGITSRIAYVPGDVALWPNLSGGETIDLLTSLRGGATDRDRDRLIDAFELDPRKKSRTYSKGNRQKVALVAAFARPADLYILDEPTSGLDPLMEAVFRDEIARVRGRGATVLLSSHLLSEVEQLCDRVTIIRSGTAVETSTLAELRQRTGTRFRVTGVARASVDRIDGVSAVETDGDVLEFEASRDATKAVLAALAAAEATSVVANPPTLESMFLRHYATTSTR